ncbi:MAG: phosphoribosylaminoimidazolecarboxamide formyltransferase [Pseudomonadales bacterium]|nr:phosphoribosylaminoimidazolecarboxamide formyltransferase [Pseudomonadales bacterium]
MKLDLKYGCNPHQARAAISHPGEPLRVLNGVPGYINLLDALTAWQLVRELKRATGKTAAASYKHVSPAGAAIARPLTEEFCRSQFVKMEEYSDVACAYIRARAGDRLCSFGDVAAVSDTVDVSLARVLKREVSDLIVAPAFEEEALEMLKSKKGGNYVILEMNPDYEPPEIEHRELFGFTLEQERDRGDVGDLFQDLPMAQRETMQVATLALKFAQSNSVCVAWDGQVIGLGAGQQSRIHCTRLACDKAEKWMLQFHPRVLELPFVEGLGRPERTNAIDQFLLWDALSPPERKDLLSLFTAAPEPLSREERIEWVGRFDDLCLSSDAYIPFRDNIDRAATSNIRIIAHPGGSVRDEAVKDACAEHGIRLIETGLRCFLH